MKFIFLATACLLGTLLTLFTAEVSIASNLTATTAGTEAMASSNSLAGAESLLPGGVVSDAETQRLTGVITDAETGESIIGASLFWIDFGTGTVSDLDGRFNLEIPELPALLAVSMVGYRADTFQVMSGGEIGLSLFPGTELDAVQIEGRKQAASLVETINQVTLDRDELNRAACCNLSEAFENSNDVDVEFTDAATGAKQVRMLGLDGRFVQILEENATGFRGLSLPYRLGLVPGTWMEAIHVTQGPGSVRNGYESLAGQLNVEYWKPDNIERFFVNGYGSIAGRAEVNVHGGTQLSDKVGTAGFAHLHGVFLENDRNNDGFVDIPMSTMAIVMNRWKFTGEGAWRGQIAGRYVHQDLRGGQVGFDHSNPGETQDLYGVDVAIRRAEVWTKTAWIDPLGNGRSIGLQLKGVWHEQEGTYGRRNYDGREGSFNANLLVDQPIAGDVHAIRYGASFMLDDISESYHPDPQTESQPDLAFERTELVPGLFAEYQLASGAWTLVGGLRADWVNVIDELVLTPRLHLRHRYAEGGTWRISGGRGFRTVNPIIEHTSWIVSSRELQVITPAGSPLVESGWSAGAGFVQTFNLAGREGSVRADYRFTGFTDRVVADVDADPDFVTIRASDGFSRSHAAQIAVDWEAVKGLDIRLAFKYEDVRLESGGILRLETLVPRYRGLASVGYTTPKGGWTFDATLQVVGPQRLPQAPAISSVYYENSPVYPVLNGQISKSWTKWALYVGAENAIGYRQDDPIRAAADPFGPDFDAATVWGPVLGRNIYAGFRLAIN